ncbi:hypothetical protein [Paenibacillus terreus]
MITRMFKLPFSFIITGMISFVLYHVSTLVDFAGWITEYPRTSDGWYMVHLLVLGWATMIAMGAVYQLVSVVLQSAIYSEKLGFVQYGLFTLGTAGLLFAFRTAHAGWIAICATAAFLGIMLFLWNIGATLWKSRRWNPVTLCTAAAVSYLGLTGMSGMLLGMDFHFNWLGIYHDRLFGAHVWLGMTGWFGLLIVGFSYKLLPMFLLSHHYPERLQKVIVLLWNAAVWCGVLGFMTDWGFAKSIAFLMLAGALVLYCCHVQQMYTVRHKPDPGAGVTWAVWAARLLAAEAVIASVSYLFIPDQLSHSFIVMMVWSYLYGWVGITMMGYLSKIVPFLWWTHKYGPQVGKTKVPTMGQLLLDRPVSTSLAILTICLLLLLIGMGSGQGVLVGVAGSALSVAALIYMSLIARVFTK